MPRSSNLTGPIPRALVLWRQEHPERNIENAIYEAFRDAILSGELPTHTRLVPHRKIAASLGVARSTVQLALERLTDEGYLRATVGRGTYVEDVTDYKRVVNASPAVKPNGPLPRIDKSHEGVGAFRAGVPALDHFPRDRWIRAVRRVTQESPATLLDKRDLQGNPLLRSQILAHIRRTRGIRGTEDNILIVPGAQAAFTLIARALEWHEEAVCVEDPGYLPLREALEFASARVIACPVDDAGFDVASAQTMCPSPRAVVVTPSHQFPLGVRMNIARRVALLEWVCNIDAYVVEDDYDSEFRYGGTPLPALQSIDTGERVIYIGTFSKTLYPGLRLAYVVAPLHLIKRLRNALGQSIGMAPTLEQAALAEFLRSDDFARHLRRSTKIYARRRDQLIRSLETRFDERELRLLSSNPSGLHVTALLSNESIADSDIVMRMRERGITLHALSSYCANRSMNGLIFGFGGADETVIDPAIAMLREVWDPLKELDRRSSSFLV